MTDDLCEVCVTGPDADALTELTHWLVTARLAAGGHVTGPIRSIYRWEGEIRDHQEWRVALHTRRALVDDIVTVAVDRHPYKVPGVFVVPLIGGSTAYNQWVRDQTTGLVDEVPTFGP